MSGPSRPGETEAEATFQVEPKMWTQEHRSYIVAAAYPVIFAEGVKAGRAQ